MTRPVITAPLTDERDGQPVWAADEHVLAEWMLLAADKDYREEMQACYEELSKRPYPDWPGERHNRLKGARKHVQHWPVWQFLIAGKTFLVLYHRTDAGPEIFYVGPREML
jgi:hypothetical protein